MRSRSSLRERREWGTPGAGRLLIVARELTRGGAAYLALRHARMLAERYTVDVVATGACDDDFVGEFPERVTVHRLAEKTLAWDADWRRLLRGFARAHADEAPFRHEYQAVLATSTFPDLSACAVVTTVRASRRFLFLVDEGLGFFPALESPAREIVKHCVDRADLVLPVSRRLWHRMAGSCPALLAREWRCVRPPVDVGSVRRLASGPQSVVTRGDVPAVLTIARLSPEKQVPLCVRVHHALETAGVHFRWYVVGTGPDEPRVRAEIRDLGLEDRFILLGHQENVFPVLNACEVLALFSHSEGCPTVVLEALALGVPVIMTGVGGADEVVEHGATGLIVDPDPDAIAAGLARMVQDADLRRSFRENLGRIAASRKPDPRNHELAALVEDPGPPAPVPRVSILVPTYNQEQSIDRAIASALGQDYPSLEVVVLDDGSTDGTGRAARDWVFDPRFRYVRNESNLGRVANYRRGLTEHARGEWVLMLDGDDFLSDPGFIRRACRAIDQCRDRPIVFAQAGHRVHHVDGRQADLDVLPAIEGPSRVLTGAEYLRFVFETGFFTHLGALYRRDAAIRARAYTAEISSSDMDSLLRLALDGEVLLLNQIAGCWVQHGANTSAHLPLDRLRANARIFRRIARLAIRRGLSTWAELDGPLTRYEVRTLGYLFGTMIGKSARGPLALDRFLFVAFSVNPGLFRDERFLAVCRHFAEVLPRPATGRDRPSSYPERRLRMFQRRLDGDRRECSHTARTGHASHGLSSV